MVSLLEKRHVATFADEHDTIHNLGAFDTLSSSPSSSSSSPDMPFQQYQHHQEYSSSSSGSSIGTLRTPSSSPGYRVPTSPLPSGLAFKEIISSGGFHENFNLWDKRLVSLRNDNKNKHRIYDSLSPSGTVKQDPGNDDPSPDDAWYDTFDQIPFEQEYVVSHSRSHHHGHHHGHQETPDLVSRIEMAASRTRMNSRREPDQQEEEGNEDDDEDDEDVEVYINKTNHQSHKTFSGNDNNNNNNSEKGWTGSSRGRSKWPRLLWRSQIDRTSLRALKEYHERTLGQVLPLLLDSNDPEQVKEWTRKLDHAGL